MKMQLFGNSEQLRQMESDFDRVVKMLHDNGGKSN